MATELVSTLWHSTLASTAAMLLVMLSRAQVRRSFGASIAYASWLLVPAAGIAILLPAPVALLETNAASASMATFAGQIASDSKSWIGAQPWWLAWATGALMMAAWLTFQQHRFVRQLGGLDACVDGIQRAHGCAGLPAVHGLWRPRIVLPMDFEQRYDTDEQALILAHERAHLGAGDLHAHALVAVLRCVYWFNPLLHIAAVCFRQDQEMARDQAVIARFPAQRRRYAETMLKTRLAVSAVPVVCHWSGIQPLKERITMLKYPFPSRRRRVTGAVLVAGFAVLLATAAWSAQPARVVAPVSSAGGAMATHLAASAVTQAANEAVAKQTFAERHNLTHLPPPKYPAQAAKDKIGGEVMLKILVGADGTAKQVVVEKSQPAGVFDANTLEAARQWTFEPKISGGKPVEEWVRVPVTFAIDPEHDAATGQHVPADAELM